MVFGLMFISISMGMNIGVRMFYLVEVLLIIRLISVINFMNNSSSVIVGRFRLFS